jgi:ubiquinol-cytochrome c reductase cytochrome b subunit
LGITSKFLGFIIFAASIAILFVVPWLDRSNVQSIRYKGIYSKIAMILFAASFITLGYLGTKPVNELRTLVAQICTVLYFAPFILMPIYTKYEKTLEVPDRL